MIERGGMVAFLGMNSVGKVTIRPRRGK